MEWVSGSDGSRLFECEDGTALLTGSFWGGRTCPALINARWVTGPLPLVLSGAEKWKCWWWAFAFRQQSFSGEVGCGTEERWGSRRRRRVSRMLEQGLWEIALPGAPLLRQLWKFIAIDFVISSLSIGSTWAHWWIARKLFLQSCFFFKSASPPRLPGSMSPALLSCPSVEMSPSLFIFSFLFPPRCKTFNYNRFKSGLLLKRVCACGK